MACLFWVYRKIYTVLESLPSTTELFYKVEDKIQLISRSSMRATCSNWVSEHSPSYILLWMGTISHYMLQFWECENTTHQQFLVLPVLYSINFLLYNKWHIMVIKQFTRLHTKKQAAAFEEKKSLWSMRRNQKCKKQQWKMLNRFTKY